MLKRIGLIVLVSLLISGSVMAGLLDFLKKGGFKSKTVQIDFEKQVKPILVEYCYDCHGDGMDKGGLDFEAYKGHPELLADRKMWQAVLQNVGGHIMPPEKKAQPTQEQREIITQWIDATIFKTDCENPDPGRVTIRRLNRVEYNNTVRDLVGIDFQPADDFPADDSGYGFDNIGDVLSVPPVLLEKYLSAAEKIMDAAVMTDSSTNGPTKRLLATSMQAAVDGGPYGANSFGLYKDGEIFTKFNFAREGEYVIRARAFATQAGNEPARMELRLDDKAVKVFDVLAVEGSPKMYEYRLQVKGGEKKLAAAYINNFRDPKAASPDKTDRNLFIDYLEVVGPIGPPTIPESHKRIFFAKPVKGKERVTAEELITRFAKRAYRRPITKNEINRLLSFYDMATKEGDGFEQSVKLALTTVLVSPHFLFRGEIQPEPNNPKSVHEVNEFALASRLSYFLWSSMPDDQLLSLAEKKALRKNLESEVKRMLRDPKSDALVQNFAGQWLQIRNLNLVAPDKGEFPTYDDDLKQAMLRETEMFFTAIMREDRSVLEFLDADYSYMNERLAKHYGIEGVKGNEFQRVALKDGARGGLLTQASILTITSNPTRTSPVKRGKWVLDNILGTPPPPPPPEVPELKEEGKALHGTLRQRMEQHRENPSCASCHARMDPIGFGMENFDGVGIWRSKEGATAIDSSGKLVTGEVFNGPAELKQMLVKNKKADFLRCLSEKMLTYGLGRGIEYYDKCAVEEIAADMASGNYKFSSLIMGVVESTPFQKRRGEGDRLAEASK